MNTKIKREDFFHDMIVERVNKWMEEMTEEDKLNYIYDRLYEEFRAELRDLIKH